MKKALSFFIALTIILSGFSAFNFVYASDEIFYHSFDNGMGDCISVSPKTEDKISIEKDDT